MALERTLFAVLLLGLGVSAHMLLQVAGISTRFVTQWTLELFLTCVCLEMGRQLVGKPKLGLTELTFEGPAVAFPILQHFFRVQIHVSLRSAAMSGKLLSCEKLPGTSATFDGLVFQVFTLGVINETSLLGETGSTLLTSKWPFSRVDQHMALQMSWRCKFFATVLACILLDNTVLTELAVLI